jgi:putative thioredoxin
VFSGSGSAASVAPMAIEVSDATFQTDVLDRSQATPVVVDLWAPWCGPCRQLSPILEKVVDETQGRVVLAKVNVDHNPQVAAAFRVQGIPAVYAVHQGKVVDGFVGAQGEDAVRAFVEKLAPSAEDEKLAELVAAGDEASLREALQIQPDHHDAIVALAELLARRRNDGDVDEALDLLSRVPDTPDVRRAAALARTGGDGTQSNDIYAKLDDLLDVVGRDDDARREFVDLLEVLGPDDPRTADYRKKLSARLF